MNSWKITWDAFFEHSSKWSYAKELWRISGWKLRVGLVVSSGMLVCAFFYFPRQSSDWKSMGLLMLSEMFFILIIDQIRGKTFGSVYGSPENTISPAEREGYRASRFLMFKHRLTRASITKSHVNDLFSILDAKIDLETHRNEVFNRFVLFVSGLLTALLITWIKGLEANDSIQVLLWLLLICALVGPALWLLPSRKERLKELKYFMLLYARGTD